MSSIESAFEGDRVPLRFAETLQNELRYVVESIYGPAVRHLPGLDVGRAYWGSNNAFRFGGDVVDVFQYGNGRASLAVVDIAGHGLGAARHASLAKYALRAYASRGFSAVEAIRALNRLCIENGEFEAEHEFFATAFFAIVDQRRQTMEYVSAGHDAAYVVTGGGEIHLGATGPIIGLMDDDATFGQASVALAEGDIIAAVTDGFTEARDAQLAFLGAPALLSVIEAHRNLRAEEQACAITERAFAYAGERLHDDVAALVVKVERADYAA